MRTSITLALVLVAGLAAAAQAPAQAQAPNLGQAASSALDTLKSAAQDRLLVADMIGHDVQGPGGNTVGTVENLVAVPGGRLVAAVVALKGGGRIPVPYQLMKVSSAQGKLGITLPASPEELRSNPAVKEMSSILKL